MADTMGSAGRAATNAGQWTMNNPDTSLRLLATASPLFGLPSLEPTLRTAGSVAEIAKYPGRQKAYEESQKPKTPTGREGEIPESTQTKAPSIKPPKPPGEVATDTLSEIAKRQREQQREQEQNKLPLSVLPRSEMLRPPATSTTQQPRFAASGAGSLSSRADSLVNRMSFRDLGGIRPPGV